MTFYKRPPQACVHACHQEVKSSMVSSGGPKAFEEKKTLLHITQKQTTLSAAYQREICSCTAVKLVYPVQHYLGKLHCIISYQPALFVILEALCRRPSHNLPKVRTVYSKFAQAGFQNPFYGNYNTDFGVRILFLHYTHTPQSSGAF